MKFNFSFFAVGDSTTHSGTGWCNHKILDSSYVLSLRADENLPGDYKMITRLLSPHTLLLLADGSLFPHL